MERRRAPDVTLIERMAQLAETPQLEPELADSLRTNLQSFFDDTTGIDTPYLTKASIEHVSRMRDIEVNRIRKAEPDRKAAMSRIKQVGKIINSLPDAIKEVFRVVSFNPEAPVLNAQADHEAEYEEDEPEDDVGDFPGVAASGTPPGTPPPLDPARPSSTAQTGRVQEVVQRIEGPQISHIPQPKWHGWKTKTGPTIADIEQSRMAPM